MSRLLTIRTDLSEYKAPQYGYDRLGAGSRNTNASGQPYELKTTPKRSFSDRDFGLDSSGLLEGADFLLRGGSLLPGALAQDVSRLTKMMTDLKSPNGLLFTIKQNALSRSGVNIKAQGAFNLKVTGDPNRLALNNGIYLPTSTLLQAAANPLGGHLLKQGINPFAETNNVNQGNVFSTGFGISLPLSNPIYLDTIAQFERQNNVNSSRLIQFLDSKINSNLGDQVNLYNYSGGPGSTLGVGKTNILMSRDRTGRNNPSLTNSNFFATEVDFGYFDYSVFKRPSVNFQGAKIFNGKNVSAIYEDLTGINVIEDQYKTNNLDTGALRLFSTNVFQPGTFNPQAPENVLGLGTTMDYNQIQNAYSGSNQNLSNGSTNNVYNRSTILQDFRLQRKKNPGIISLDYTDQSSRLEGRVNLGDPGNKTTPRTRYVTGTGEALDKITALPLYRSKDVDKSKPINDLCKFRIGVIDNNDPSFKTYIHFRAFLDNFSDSYSAEWIADNFAGRAEQLYKYQGFDRSINLAWTVAAQSKEELMPMYRKLNYLASVCAPSYSDDGYMRGNLIELTVGGYLYKQVGIMQGISYDVPQESPWEIAIGDNVTAAQNAAGQAFSGINLGQPVQADNTVKELPMMIKVSGFKFIPIHSFVPSIQENLYGDSDTDNTGKVTTYGDQRYIALTNNFSNNYTDFVNE